MTVTTSPCSDTQPPTAPTNVTASTRTTTSIALTWAPATDNVGVAGYGVYNGADLVDTTAGNTGIASGLTCGTNYTLSVDAFDATGNSSPKTAVMVSTLPCGDTTPPSQPTNLRTTSATTTSLTIAWNAATDNVAVASYDIYRATTKAGSATTTTYTINGLTCGTTYSVGVRAIDTTGNTSTQATLPTTTSPCAPALTCDRRFPDASSTGVPAGTTLTAYTGPSTITTSNTVIDGKTTGCLTINATGVIIRNSRVSGACFWALHVNSGSVTIEDSEIDCQGSNGTGIGSSNVTVRRSDICRCENGFDVGPRHHSRDSWIHDLYRGGAQPRVFRSAGRCNKQHDPAGAWDELDLTVVHNVGEGHRRTPGRSGNAEMISAAVHVTSTGSRQGPLTSGGSPTIDCAQNAEGHNAETAPSSRRSGNFEHTSGSRPGNGLSRGSSRLRQQSQPKPGAPSRVSEGRP